MPSFWKTSKYSNGRSSTTICCSSDSCSSGCQTEMAISASCKVWLRNCSEPSSKFTSAKIIYSSFAIPFYSLTYLTVIDQIPNAKTARISDKKTALGNFQRLRLTGHCHFTNSGVPLLRTGDLEKKNTFLCGRSEIMMSICWWWWIPARLNTARSSAEKMASTSLGHFYPFQVSPIQCCRWNQPNMAFFSRTDQCNQQLKQLL